MTHAYLLPIVLDRAIRVPKYLGALADDGTIVANAEDRWEQYRQARITAGPEGLTPAEDAAIINQLGLMTFGRIVWSGKEQDGQMLVSADTNDAQHATLLVQSDVVGAVVTAEPPTPRAAPVWTLRASDDFTDTAGRAIGQHTPNLGNVWVDESAANWQCAAGVCLGCDQSVPGPRCRNTTPLQDTQAIEMTVAQDQSAYALGVHMSPSGNGYAFLWRGNVFADVFFHRIDAGVYTQIATGPSGTGNSVAGDPYRLEVDGTTLTAIVKGVTRLTYASATAYTSGSAGVALVLTGPLYTMGDNARIYDSGAVVVGGGGGDVRKVGRLVAVRGSGTPHPRQLRPARITVVGSGTIVDCKVSRGETYAALPEWKRSAPMTTGWVRT